MATTLAYEHRTTRGTQQECIFHQAWGLEAADPGHRGEIRVERNAMTLARSHYTITKTFGLTALTMRPFTFRPGP